LDHSEAELDGDNLAEVFDGSDEWIVAVTVEQRLHQSHFVLTTQTWPTTPQR